MDVHNATLSEYQDGHLAVQTDGYGKDAGLPPAEVQAHGGVLYRPLDPEVDDLGEVNPQKACAVLTWWEGGRQFVIPTVDPRIMALLPELGKGGACLYGGTDGGVSVVHIDPTSLVVSIGSVASATPVALANALGQYLTLLETLLAALSAAADGSGTPPSAPALTTFTAASAIVKALIPAILVKAT